MRPRCTRTRRPTAVGPQPRFIDPEFKAAPAPGRYERPRPRTRSVRARSASVPRRTPNWATRSAPLAVPSRWRTRQCLGIDQRENASLLGEQRFPVRGQPRSSKNLDTSMCFSSPQFRPTVRLFQEPAIGARPAGGSVPVPVVQYHPKPGTIATELGGGAPGPFGRERHSPHLRPRLGVEIDESCVGGGRSPRCVLRRD